LFEAYVPNMTIEPETFDFFWNEIRVSQEAIARVFDFHPWVAFQPPPRYAPEEFHGILEDFFGLRRRAKYGLYLLLNLCGGNLENQEDPGRIESNRRKAEDLFQQHLLQIDYAIRVISQRLKGTEFDWIQRPEAGTGTSQRGRKPKMVCLSNFLNTRTRKLSYREAAAELVINVELYGQLVKYVESPFEIDDQQLVRFIWYAKRFTGESLYYGIGMAQGHLNGMQMLDTPAAVLI